MVESIVFIGCQRTSNLCTLSRCLCVGPMLITFDEFSDSIHIRSYFRPHLFLRINYFLEFLPINRK